MSNSLLQKQNELYGNLNFAAAIKKDNVGIIKHFIASEKEAYENNFQGQFYPSYHYEISRVMSTKMSKIDDEDIYLAFYYQLKLGNIYKPLEKHYPLFLKALAHNIDDNDLDNTFLDADILYLLFGIKNNENSDSVYDILYNDYANFLQFTKLCNSYTTFPNLRKKHAKFAPFLNNKALVNRIKKGLHYYFESSFLTAGSLVLLLLDTSDSAKEVLYNLHKTNLKNTDVWLLGSFYMDFKKTDANRKLLKDLYVTYPKEWIDEYQKTDWS
ncbi:hypothetical protein [Cellulophaga omnivescoria]|uniref:hypothetical protein n=1 Tax=Cellulophaga omnivescoria TaxID=1888890 RepID=UPI003EB77107